MLILVLAEEMDQALGMTLGVLNSCGFKTRVVESRELRILSKQKSILIGRHPQKRHNGHTRHRRRFTLYRRDGLHSIGYADGAEMDHLWWRDLFYKLRQLIWDEMPEREQLDLVLPLARLKKLGD